MATKQNPKKGIAIAQYDWALLTVVCSLLALGLVMVFSSSFSVGLTGYQDPFYFFLRQLAWTGLSIFVLIVVSSIRYTFWEQWSIGLMAAALLALLMVLTFGADRFGASRTFMNGSIQPSEPAKIAIIIYVSTWLASKGSRIRDVRVGLIPFSVLMGLITVLIVFQPDISTAFLIVSTAFILFFIAGADLKQLLFVGIVTAATFMLVVQNSVYANARVEKFFGSIDNPLASDEFQVRWMVSALINGGPIGKGIGQGDTYVPLGWSDNIFAVIGEEMGLLGAMLIILLFGLFTYCGLRTALRAPDHFGMLLAIGITSIVVLQAILNAAVVVAVAPPTGVTLPFVSYGGSSLVTMMGAVGILLSIGRFSGENSAKPSELGNLAYARFDFGWWNGRSRLSRSGRASTNGRAADQKGQAGKPSGANKPKKPAPPGKSTPRRTPGKRVAKTERATSSPSRKRNSQSRSRSTKASSGHQQSNRSPSGGRGRRGQSTSTTRRR
ncbi:MAG: FtsW/RodA/SpoVE family cell cycle protein [Chloroflexota bacterium]